MSTTTTASGLQYEDTVVGEGAEAKAGAYVTVHYTGWLRNDDGSTGAALDTSAAQFQGLVAGDVLTVASAAS